MPRHRVIFQAEAEQNVLHIGDWIAGRSSDGAKKWLDRFLCTIELIRNTPEQFAVAPESKVLNLEVRQATFRMRSGRTYRIVFRIAEDGIHILYVRAPGQDAINP